MSKGRVEAIYRAAKPGDLPGAVAEVEARAGHGLVGDRHYQAGGPDGPKYSADRELTLIESETIEALARDAKIELDPAESRRNVLTRGVPLNHLVGREFRVGEVRARGIELCEPCGRLQKFTSSEVRKALVHRGGLRAAILEGGMIRVGDTITTDEVEEDPAL